MARTSSFVFEIPEIFLARCAAIVQNDGMEAGVVRLTPKNPALQAAVVALALAICAHADDIQPDQTGTDRAAAWPAYPLRVEGSAIEQLTLTGARGEMITVTRPAETIELPAGRYRVHQVELTGGFRGFAGAEDTWVRVATDESPVLKVGAPLEPQVRIARRGRVLALDYDLVDAQGRLYRGGSDSGPPTFTVYKNGRAIGNGSFEYG